MPEEKEEKQEYEPFSEQEKKKILQRHKELVERFNRTLPDSMKVKIDPDLEKKLDGWQGVAGVGIIGVTLIAITALFLRFRP